MIFSAKVAAVEFAGDTVRVVVVKAGGGRPAIIECHAVTAEYSDEDQRIEALTAAVTEVVGRLKARPAAYVLCAASEFAVARTLSLPFRGRRRVGAAVPFELEPYLAFPVDDLVIDFLPVSESSEGTEALAVGIRRELLEEQVGALLEAGVDPQGIGLDVVGLTFLLEAGRRGGSSASLRSVLHVREEGAILTVLHRKVLAFFRHLPVSAEDLAERPEKVVREVQNSLRSFHAMRSQEGEIDELTVTGLDLDEDAQTDLSDRMGLPVTCVDLMTGLKGLDRILGSDEGAGAEGEDEARGERQAARQWVSAVGVAASMVRGAACLNFRKDALAQPASSMMAQLRQGVFTLGLAFVLVIGYALYCQLGHRRNMAALEQIGQEMWDTYTHTFPASEVRERPEGDVGGKLTYQLMAEASANIEPTGYEQFVGFLQRPTLVDILAELAERLPDDKATITDLKIRTSDEISQDVTIIAEIHDPAASSEAERALRESSVLEIGDVLRGTEGTKSVFTILGRTLPRTP